MSRGGVYGLCRSLTRSRWFIVPSACCGSRLPAFFSPDGPAASLSAQAQVPHELKSTFGVGRVPTLTRCGRSLPWSIRTVGLRNGGEGQQRQQDQVEHDFSLVWRGRSR
jgi:hypothetical protein